MILKSDHPYGNFLHARRLALEWMRVEMGYSDEALARAFSMDEMQVTLILMTPVEPLQAKPEETP